MKTESTIAIFTINEMCNIYVIVPTLIAKSDVTDPSLCYCMLESARSNFWNVDFLFRLSHLVYTTINSELIFPSWQLYNYIFSVSGGLLLTCWTWCEIVEC